MVSDGVFTEPLLLMKRRLRNRLEADASLGFDISSLIDVCFLLLIYFIVTSVILPRESDLDIGPPGERPTKWVVTVEPFLITIESSGAVCCGEGAQRELLDSDVSVRELPLLVGQLEFYKSGLEAAGSKPLVVIEAADEASHQRVVDVLNALAEVGIEKVSFRDPQKSD